jgi:hypothetical protein
VGNIYSSSFASILQIQCRLQWPLLKMLMCQVPQSLLFNLKVSCSLLEIAVRKVNSYIDYL